MRYWHAGMGREKIPWRKYFTKQSPAGKVHERCKGILEKLIKSLFIPVTRAALGLFPRCSTGELPRPWHRSYFLLPVSPRTIKTPDVTDRWKTNGSHRRGSSKHDWGKCVSVSGSGEEKTRCQVWCIGKCWGNPWPHVFFSYIYYTDLLFPWHWNTIKWYPAVKITTFNSCWYCRKCKKLKIIQILFMLCHLEFFATKNVHMVLVDQKAFYLLIIQMVWIYNEECCYGNLKFFFLPHWLSWQQH